ncbi:pyroglutamyl-peptidase 1-like protein [Dinothrombium tinctorium]|uniref:Pyroglutamyl-peptidase 1-like protein n=1 Tax=Dinothrombium tinctorium TaxID=1965070 RepID=A0A3S3P9Y0_9ACAR|nr:pyroglutamyl-peptidase 1-like protein [Dinothrombium tinctorium]RWS11017.1 pyroglutamyl-peptidase 1-like protein [Dinothrombium tinctorium]RWS12144.1 pyroglutamyl-peptidase 1-like protein [Dinothrombium tinctorium]
METGSESKPTVLVTGRFGVFAHYEKNASWEAVKLLEMDDVNLVKYEIPVAYDFVDENIPQLWQKHKPEMHLLFNALELSNETQMVTIAGVV